MYTNATFYISNNLGEPNSVASSSRGKSYLVGATKPWEDRKEERTDLCSDLIVHAHWTR